ncbi:hypothetical protein EMIHUDRAFT_349842, partial [Emiliania huxleyi CCMP1516]|uniref:Uncharacterized protein n=2 Tax=Emiliania huxleyi TaxID=2903 RepID=A0A0D3J3J6_EMIH1
LFTRTPHPTFSLPRRPPFSTFFGSSSSCWSPWPSLPEPPSPQLQTAPSAVRAMLWSPPANTATTRRAVNGQCLDLLGQRLALPVAVAQLARGAIAPAPYTAVGGEGEAVASKKWTAGAAAPPRRASAPP